MDHPKRNFFDICECFKRNDPTLTQLNLGSKEINRYNITIYHSIYLFIYSHTLTYHSTGNQIDSKGAESLAEALKSNTTLIQFDLESE
jgi:hypothetical protein